MKKSYIIIAAAAAMFAACSDNDSIKQIGAETNGNDAIAFSTFTNKQTRAENSNALYTWAFLNNHTSFQVWGYKDVAPTDAVFKATKVTVSGEVESSTYAYDTLRFWDKTAEKYHFYAAAPATPDGDNPAWKWTFVSTGITNASTLNKGYFTTTSEITGVNLKNLANVGPGTQLSNYFKGQADIDKMIAAPCDFAKSRYAKPNPEAVQLNFNHILSKLNITVRKGANISNDLYVVKLKSFAVKNMQSKGDFSEEDPADATGTNARWDLTNYTTSTVDYVALTNVTSLLNSQNQPEFTVTNTDNYIVESLVIPQDIDFKKVALDGKHHDAVLEEAEIDAVTTNTKPYFVITYTINDEVFTAYYNLAAAFGATGAQNNDKIAFYEGWQNTLHIVINPDKIEFTADVAEWSTYKNETVYVTEEEQQNP
ncbi:MAG: fimbrillin family protein [Bacteroidaceae bacterium]|nr:fimbrillin family protein [Bacteroidaceae bacterium]